jgi:hypothetical protein
MELPPRGQRRPLCENVLPVVRTRKHDDRGIINPPIQPGMEPEGHEFSRGWPCAMGLGGGEV